MRTLQLLATAILTSLVAMSGAARADSSHSSKRLNATPAVSQPSSFTQSNVGLIQPGVGAGTQCGYVGPRTTYICR